MLQLSDCRAADVQMFLLDPLGRIALPGLQLVAPGSLCAISVPPETRVPLSWCHCTQLPNPVGMHLTESLRSPVGGPAPCCSIEQASPATKLVLPRLEGRGSKLHCSLDCCCSVPSVDSPVGIGKTERLGELPVMLHAVSLLSGLGVRLLLAVSAASAPLPLLRGEVFLPADSGVMWSSPPEGPETPAVGQEKLFTWSD